MMTVTLAAMTIAASFTVGESNGRWMFQSAGTKPFWSLGVCCTDPGEPWSKYTPDNHAYAAHRLFDNEKAWMTDTLAKLTSNGFNSIGGWSDTNIFRKYGGDKRLPYFEVLHLGAYDRAPWRDMFSPAHVAIVEKAAKDQIEKAKDDPYLVGYFSDNELGWWREALFTTYLAMGKKEPGRKHFNNLLRLHYKNSFTSFEKDWSTSKKSFEELGTEIKLKPGQNGMLAVKAWQTYLTDHYYRLMQTSIRKFDKTRLILGDRYCQFYYPNVAKSAAKYVDVVSTNYGADWNNGQNTEYYLSSLHALTKKPVLITEFYMAAMENRSGNKNSSGGFPVVQTQKERAESVKTYLSDIGRRPYVLGAHWFQFFDEPAKGRGDGENYNMGLVDTNGKPYDELLSVFRDFKPSAPWTPNYNSSLPTAPSSMKEGVKNWDKAAALLKPGADPAFGDLYAASDDAHLYIGLASMGFTDEALYPSKKVPEMDRSQLRVVVNGSEHWVRFGGDKRECTHDKSAEIVYWRDGVRSELVVKIPRPKTNRIQVSAELTTHGRADRMTWKDERNLSQ